MGSAAAVAAEAQPGVDTLGFVAAADPGLLCPADLVDAVLATERLLGYVHAVQVRLLAELGKPNRCVDVTDLVGALVDKAGQGRTDGVVDPEVVAELTRDRSVGAAATELAALVDCSPITARIRIGQATRLLDALPATFAALTRGRIDIGRTRMIVDRTAVLAPELCRQLEQRVLPLVRGRSKARLENLVDREVITADPAAAEHRRSKARTGRALTHYADKDGMGIINALLPAEAALMVFNLVDLIAQANQGLDERTVDQRRADALADIADELLTHGYVDLDGLTATITNDPTGSRLNAAGGSADTAPSGGSGAVDGDVPNSGGQGFAPTVDVPCPADVDTDTETDTDTDTDNAPADSPKPGQHPSIAVEPASAATPPDATGRRSAAGQPGPTAIGWRRSSRILTRHGRRPHLIVTGAESTLRGLDDLPGHLQGHGAITAPLLRAIAASFGTLTAVAVNPDTGAPTGIGALTYRPSQQLQDQIITLHSTCRMPGCRQPAWRCDIDHLEPFNHHEPDIGGHTDLRNTIPHCKFHHLLKHHTRWTPHLQPDLTIRWTTPTGHTAISHPTDFITPGEHTRAGSPHTTTRANGCGTEAGDGCTGCDTGSLCSGVILGPTITGPTMPLAVDPDFTESHTELEDATTIPHPAGHEIHTYRIERFRTRQKALSRIRRIPIPTLTTAAGRSPAENSTIISWPPPDHTHSTEPVTKDGRILGKARRTSTNTPDHPTLPDEPPF